MEIRFFLVFADPDCPLMVETRLLRRTIADAAARVPRFFWVRP